MLRFQRCRCDFNPALILRGDWKAWVLGVTSEMVQKVCNFQNVQKHPDETSQFVQFTLSLSFLSLSCRLLVGVVLLVLVVWVDLL